ncbi:hypothetical protein, partial [Catenulispora rubra]|uniref:hypothetical protein n=1 Tax=Catenulispora rubra TaxID=280293 RepID=UPI001E489B1B
GGWDLRCYRMLLLAQAAGESTAVERWRSEEPSNSDAAVLYARTAVIRAIRSQRAQQPQAPALAELAERSCMAAVKYAPADPTPWVARLQLHACAPGEVAPRQLMEEVQLRDEWNREAFHRLLPLSGPSFGGRMTDVYDVARWASSTAPFGSPLHVLPLLAYIEEFQQRVRDDSPKRLFNADRHWAAAQALLDIERAYTEWFASGVRAAPRLLPDLHLMAHGLWRAGYYTAAKPVFAEIGRFALTKPWSLHGHPNQIFTWARGVCMHASGPNRLNSRSGIR